MAKKISVAAVQMIYSANLAENLDTAAELIKKASAQGATVIVLPEYFCMMGLKDSDKVAIQEPYGNGPIQERLQIGRAHV